MQISCSDTMPDLPRTTCDGKPLPAQVLPVMYAQRNTEDTAKYQMYKAQLDTLLAAAKPEFLAASPVLVCKNEEEASYMRLLLDRRGLVQVATRVAKKLPDKKAFRVARNRAGYKGRRAAR